MSQETSKAQTAAQAGLAGKAAGVGPAVGVLRSSWEVPVMGMEPRRGTCPYVRRGCGRRSRKGIRRTDRRHRP
jgi:hypothetical protein